MIKMIIVLLATLCSSVLYCDAPPIGSNIITNFDIPGTIVSPGGYTLGEQISYNATDTTPAIKISVSNVNLDLSNQIFSQSNNLPGVPGIVLAPNITNINIYNGNIQNFTQSGITVTQQDGMVQLEDLYIIGCGNRGVEMVGAVGATAFQLQLHSCNFVNCCTWATSDNVLTLSNCTDIKVKDCVFSTNGSSVATSTITGIQLTNCNRYFFDNVGISNSTGNLSLRGISFRNSSGGFFKDCRVANGVATASTSTSRGFYLEGGTNNSVNFFKDCIAAGLQGNTVDAYLSDTGCNGNMFFNCIAAANIATGATGVVHGFRSVNNSRTTFRDCESRGGTAATSTASPYAVYAYKLDTTTANAARNCYGGVATTVAGSSVGFYANQPVGCLFLENVASFNTQGFDFRGTFTNNTFVKNLAEHNTNTAQYTNFPTTAVSDSVWSSSVEVISGPWTNIGIN